jgi:hypothetical protein
VWWPGPASPGANSSPCSSSSPPSSLTLSTGGRARLHRCPPVRRPVVARPPHSSVVATQDLLPRTTSGSYLHHQREDNWRAGPPAGRGGQLGRGRASARVHVRISSLLVEIGPEWWTPTQQPPEFSPPFACFRRAITSTGARRGNAKLNRTVRKQGNNQQTGGRRTGRRLRCSLLITVCPFHYKGFTIYRRPLGMVICLNYTFSVPDKLL